jgi:arginyl-tRNA synthetase
MEYSSPNTNKPLHLGHLRNNFLGWSVAEILKANGNDVAKTCVVNDRGIHICKSMIAWEMFANGATPESTNAKGDHFVGDYYVKFSNELKKQRQPILESIDRNDLILFSEDEKLKINKGKETLEKLELDAKKAINGLDHDAISKLGTQIEILCESAGDGNIKWKDIIKAFDDKRHFDLDQKEKESKQKTLQKLLKPIIVIEEKIDKEEDEIKTLAENRTSIMKATQEMLVDWEKGKPEVIDLWKKMNGWVYKGFDETYKRIGSDFDKIYYESETYLLGKQFVEQGLQQGVFYKKEDGSIWIDLTSEGLDEKLVLRKDGTSVYITQDLGLAEEKYKDFKYDQSAYVIADEQNYHMKVLELILKKLDKPYADGIFHLSYGMVDLPTGRMKSREGTVVDADDLVDEMVNIAAKHTQELGKVKDFTENELKELYDILGLGALKFYLLRVDPKKRMVFNPEESIDFHGFTGPFIQYTHARIKSILRREKAVSNQPSTFSNLLKLEKELLLMLEQYSTIVKQAADEYNPSVIAIYAFNVAKTYNTFYTEHSVLNAESEEKKQLRLQLCQLTANVIKDAMNLLGIKVPERM